MLNQGFQNAMGVSASARKTPQVSQCAKKRGFRYPKKPPQVSRYAKNRGFEHAKNAIRSFANSSKPENNTLQFLTPQKCLPKSPKVAKRHPKFPYTPKSREFPNIQPKPRPRSPPTTPPKRPISPSGGKIGCVSENRLLPLAEVIRHR